jgi:hypothetical protein
LDGNEKNGSRGTPQCVENEDLIEGWMEIAFIDQVSLFFVGAISECWDLIGA